MSQGAVALVASGVTKITYGHSNSEPDYLGWDLLAMLKTVLVTPAQEAAVKAQVNALVGLPSTRDVTDTELGQITAAHPEITSRALLRAKLRALLGDIPGTLNFGIYEDYVAFNNDPGLTQLDWGYLVDFDARVFEIYRGNQFGAPTVGRLVGLPQATGFGMRQLYPLQRVGLFTFTQVNAATLPTRWWAN